MMESKKSFRYFKNVFISFVLLQAVVLLLVLEKPSILKWGNYRTATSKKAEANKEASPMFNLIPQIQKNTNILIIINTIPPTSERRDTLRETWAKQTNVSIPSIAANSSSHDIMSIAYFFMMAFERNSSIDEDVVRESQIYGDILRVNLNESYRGMVKKIFLTFEWVTNLDIKPDFIIKADDDIYIKIPDLGRWLHENSQLSPKLYTGFVRKQGIVLRNPENKWYVSTEQYADDYYPEYCFGSFYLFSRNLLVDVVKASKATKPFPIEDAFVGVLVKQVGSKARDTSNVLFNRNVTLNKILLERKKSRKKIVIPSGVVLGDFLTSEVIKMIHRVYNRHNRT